MAAISRDESDELEELEHIYRLEAFGSCEVLYRVIYEHHFASGTPEKADAIEVILSAADPGIKSACSSLSGQSYHPIFITDSKGKFVFFNKVATSIFRQFQLSTRRTAMELYNDGAIFKEGTGNVQMTYKDMLFRAMERRWKDGIPVDRMALTGGNDLVFFSYSVYQKKLVAPVTATLYVSTLHNKEFLKKTIGTLGIMSIPLVLGYVHHTRAPKSAFAGLPFGKTWSSSVSEVIRKAVLAAGLDPKIGYYRESTDIIRQMREDIAKAELFIADMTGSNPNVAYEIGFAHGRRKKVIVLNQKVAKSPFDFMVVGQLKYGTSEEGLRELHKELFEAIKEIRT